MNVVSRLLYKIADFLDNIASYGVILLIGIIVGTLLTAVGMCCCCYILFRKRNCRRRVNVEDIANYVS